MHQKALYSYIKCPSKGFSERHAKLIFHKILRGVKAIHNAGICHRDLKMENILLDDKFDPKICDFGYGAEIKGKDGSGKLDLFVGTNEYCSPEIQLNIEYEGVKVDIFSLGFVLFTLVTCNFGFQEATKGDKYYKNIIENKTNDYWNKILQSNKVSINLKNLISNTLTKEFKDLYIKMISYSPDQRPSIDEIINDPWMIEVTSLDDKSYSELEKEVYKEFEKREEEVLNQNETIDSDRSSSFSDFYYGNDRGISDDVNYFDLSLKPKYIQKTELIMNNYIKIKGNLIPSKFMNLLANNLVKNFGDKVTIEESMNTLKFNAIFDETLEDEELKEESDKLPLEKTDELEEAIAYKDCGRSV